MDKDTKKTLVKHIWIILHKMTFFFAEILSHGVAMAHQRRAGGASDANDGRHPL